MTGGDAILSAIEAASDALGKAGVRYALIGGAAMPAWGRSRATADADLLLNLDVAAQAGGPSIVTLIETLRHAGFAHLERADRRHLGDRWVLHFWYPIRDRGFSVRVDLMLVAGEEGQSVLDRARLRKIDGLTVVVASCEDLILLMLAAGRPIDLADACELLAINAGALDDEFLAREAGRRGLGQPLDEARAGARGGE